MVKRNKNQIVIGAAIIILTAGAIAVSYNYRPKSLVNDTKYLPISQEIRPPEEPEEIKKMKMIREISRKERLIRYGNH